VSKTTKELLLDRKAELETEIAALKAKSGPLRAARDKLRDGMLPVEAEVRRLNQEIKALEQPTLSDLENEYAALARALGAKSMKTQGAATKKVGTESSE